jgi:hypothetical protein
MKQLFVPNDVDRYAQCIEMSKRVRWNIDQDVIRGRQFDFSQKFLPDDISRVNELIFLNTDEQRLLSQIQGRTYANMFGFAERFVTAKILEITKHYWLGNQTALESLIRFSDEEVKHQHLFRRIESMMAVGMPDGYTFVPDPDEIAEAVLKKSTWAVLALILEIELFSQEHYEQGIAMGENLSELYKDIFLFHSKEEATHTIMDEMEWAREDGRLSPEQRNKAVDDFISLVIDLDGILQLQSVVDVEYFMKVCGRSLAPDEIAATKAGVIGAYRWQYILSGIGHPRFQTLFARLTKADQRRRLENALATLR